jgi:hypothetical protein
MGFTHGCVAGSISLTGETRSEKMSQKNVTGLSPTEELNCPPMTLAQQVKGTIYLMRLTIEVARVVIAIIKLIKTNQAMASQLLRDDRSRHYAGQ